MKASMQSTSKTVIINGLAFRVWEGTSEAGIRFVALVNRLAAAIPEHQMALIKELAAKHKEPDAELSPALTSLDPTLFPAIPDAEKGPKPA